MGYEASIILLVDETRTAHCFGMGPVCSAGARGDNSISTKGAYIMKRINRIARGVFAAVVCIFVTSPTQAGMSISELSFGYPCGVSGDGTVVVGAYSIGGGGVYWTRTSGIVPIEDTSDRYSRVKGVSVNGTVVVGCFMSGNFGEAFRWTVAGKAVCLGYMAEAHPTSEACGASSDGSVIAGGGYSVNGTEAFRWTQAGGMVGLGDLPGGGFYSAAKGVSGDGTVIVGTSFSANGTEAFRWTQAGGMVGLGTLPGGSFTSRAYGVSQDGSVVIGHSFSSNGLEAFRWTQASGMVGLGDLPGGWDSSEAYGVSQDGSVVVGYSDSEGGNDAFVWDAANGMRSLKEVLIAGGVDMTGWTLRNANAVSADGKTIVGEAKNPDGDYVGYVAVIPEPATLGLLVLGGLAMLFRKRTAGC